MRDFIGGFSFCECVGRLGLQAETAQYATYEDWIKRRERRKQKLLKIFCSKRDCNSTRHAEVEKPECAREHRDDEGLQHFAIPCTTNLFGPTECIRNKKK